MIFYRELPDKVDYPCFQLNKDWWNDWYDYETQFDLYYLKKNGNKEYVGAVKVAEYNMKDRPEEREKTELPTSFLELEKERYFSLGQDESYYLWIMNNLKDDEREKFYKAINDISYNLDVYETVKGKRVCYDSLMRSVSSNSIKGHYHRLAHGNAKLTEFKFNYEIEGKEKLNLDFHVMPDSFPPTNIHTIIGRNGVGKTHLFTNMINSITLKEEEFGKFSTKDVDSIYELFSNVISVSFSAFDDNKLIHDKSIYESGININYRYIGIYKEDNSNQNRLTKTKEDLSDDFIKSLKECIGRGKLSWWKDILQILESDPLFKEIQLKKLMEKMKEKEALEERAKVIFKKLSSGHSVVLLTITRLIESLEEKSLVFLDEPESHLHPPLLSAFIRGLSELLRRKNGVAIIATHSPVILQDVPGHCAWNYSRSGEKINVWRIEEETFGENIGTLTREVFGLEVVNSGFYTLLKEKVKEYESYEEMLEFEENHFGFEARMFLRNLFRERNGKNDN